MPFHILIRYKIHISWEKSVTMLFKPNMYLLQWHCELRMQKGNKPTVREIGAPRYLLFSLLLSKNFRIKRLPCSTLTPSFRKLWYKNFLNVSHFVAALNIRYIHYPWQVTHQNYKFRNHIIHNISLKYKGFLDQNWPFGLDLNTLCKYSKIHVLNQKPRMPNWNIYTIWIK